MGKREKHYLRENGQRESTSDSELEQTENITQLFTFQHASQGGGVEEGRSQKKHGLRSNLSNREAPNSLRV